LVSAFFTELNDNTAQMGHYTLALCLADEVATMRKQRASLALPGHAERIQRA
jgi:hypothetical protein